MEYYFIYVLKKVEEKPDDFFIFFLFFFYFFFIFFLFYIFIYLQHKHYLQNVT